MPRIINRFDAKEGVLRLFGEHRSLGFPPIPTAAYGSHIVFIYDFSFIRRVVFLASQRDERFMTIRQRQPDVADKRVDILPSAWKPVTQ